MMVVMGTAGAVDVETGDPVAESLLGYAMEETGGRESK
jgi:hypothetical protein